MENPVTITRLLYLGFGLLIALFVISGVITYSHISNIAAAEMQKITGGLSIPGLF